VNNHTFKTLNEVHREGDKLLAGVSVFMLLVSIGLASWYDTWLEVMVIGLPAAIVPVVLAYIQPGQMLTRIAMGASLMIWSALLIHQSHGMIEMHFSVFVLLAFLLYYRDWVPVVAGAGVIAVHHVTFYFLQVAVPGVYLLPETGNFMIVVIHAIFVVFETAVLVYMALKSYRETVATEQMVREMNSMMDTQEAIIVEAQTISKSIRAATSDIRQSADSMSKGSSSQAASIEESSASLEQMTSTIGTNAENARHTNQAADEVSKQADETGEAVNKTVAAMSNIAEKIELIEDIAYKTNLLALNAAIEAARAGDHGKGFAVVADEVRKLAERSQSAAQEISLTAGQSVEVANQAGALLNDMIPGIQKTASLVHEIAAASEEQAAGVQQINAAVGDLDTIAQRNASEAERMTTTSATLEDVVGQLDHVMGSLAGIDKNRM